MRKIAPFMFFVLMSAACLSQSKKTSSPDSVKVYQFLKRISKKLTTDKEVKVRYEKNKPFETMALYYDPRANVQIVKSDLSKRTR